MRRFLPILLVFACVVSASANPLSKQAMLDILHSEALRADVNSFVRCNGLDFALTSEVEEELLRAGLSEAQLREIWLYLEVRAAETLRTLNSNALTYRRTYGSFPASLKALGSPPVGASISAQAANLTFFPLQPKSYEFSYTPVDSAGYTITARPASWRMHTMNFFTDQTGTIRSTVANRPATASDNVYATATMTIAPAGRLGDPQFGAGQTSPPGVFRVGAGVSPPRAVYSPDPPYPEAARKEHFMGTVVLHVIVGPDGRTSNVRVARSLRQDMDENAIQTVQQWRFQPAMKDGVPVSVEVNVEINYHLPQ